MKKENLLWHVMLEKNMLQVWETDFYSESITHGRPLIINMGGLKLHSP